MFKEYLAIPRFNHDIFHIIKIKGSGHKHLNKYCHIFQTFCKLANITVQFLLYLN